MPNSSLATLLTGAARGETSTHPLTHHEILGVIAPFTRCGRHVDLDASNRIERRLVFKPIERDGVSIAAPTATELLTLDNAEPGHYRLTRTLTLASGLEAKLQAEGADPGDLLARVETASPSQQFRDIDGQVVALSYKLTATGPGSEGAPPPQLELLRGETVIAGLQVVLKADTVKGYPANIELTPQAADEADLPEDLIAVIGWGWSPLRKRGIGWLGTVRARSQEPRRSRDLEAKMERLVAHLAGTLSQPPSAFHETLAPARWVVTFRRGIPLLFFIALMGLAVALTRIDIPQDSIFNLLMMGAPPLMLFAMFTMRTTPSLEFPPLPRRPKAAAWQLASVAAAPSASKPALAVVTADNSSIDHPVPRSQV